MEALSEMAWISVGDSNFAKDGLSVHFSDNHFVCSRGSGAGMKIAAADIIFLNDPPRSTRISGATDTNTFRNNVLGGPFGAIFMELFSFISKSKNKKRTQKIIVKFKGDRFLIGKTDFDTFFAIQNAWLDSK